MAHITDFSILTKLKNSHNRLNSDVGEGIQSVDQRILEIEQAIQAVKVKLEHRLEDAERKLYNRNMALSLCNSQTVPDPDNPGHSMPRNCSSQEHDVRIARKEQKAAREVLDQFNQLMGYLEKSRRTYEEKRQRLIEVMSNENQKAIEYLSKREQLAEEYRRISF